MHPVDACFARTEAKRRPVLCLLFVTLDFTEFLKGDRGRFSVSFLQPLILLDSLKETENRPLSPFLSGK